MEGVDCSVRFFIFESVIISLRPQQSLEHLSFRVGRALSIEWVESTDLKNETQEVDLKWKAVVSAK